MKKQNYIQIQAVLLWLLLSPLATFSQSFSLRQAVEAANASCPINLGTLGECTRIDYTNNVVTYYYSVNERIENIAELKKNPSLFRQSIMSSLTNPAGDLKMMVSMCLDKGASLRFVHKGKTSGQTISATISPAELKNCLADRTTSNEDRLREMVAISRTQMPMPMMEGMTMADMRIEGTDVIYVVKYDPQRFNFTRPAYADLKNAIIGQFGKLSETELSVFRLIAACNMGLIYRYTNEQTGSNRDIRLSNNEIRNNIPQK